MIEFETFKSQIVSKMRFYDLKEFNITLVITIVTLLNVSTLL